VHAGGDLLDLALAEVGGRSDLAQLDDRLLDDLKVDRRARPPASATRASGERDAPCPATRSSR